MGSEYEILKEGVRGGTVRDKKNKTKGNKN